MTNNRAIGNKLEEYVVAQMKEVEPNIRRTKNSGASTELEDVLSKHIMVQCKVDNIHTNIIIQINDFEQMIAALPIHSKRLPIFVNQNKNGLKTVTLLADDFFDIIRKHIGQNNE